MSTIKTASRDDILRWPDGTWCYRWEHARGGYEWLGDDFEAITEENPEYDVLCGEPAAVKPSVTRGELNEVFKRACLGPQSALVGADELHRSLDTGEADALLP